jgi:hypothetical protein
MNAVIFPFSCTSLCSDALLKTETIVYALLHLTTGSVVVTFFMFIYKFTWDKTFRTKIIQESHVKYTNKHCLQFRCIFVCHAKL